MQDFLDKKIVVGITGGIAAYKAAYLVRELVQLGADVRVVMTASAQQFITPLTMQALSGNDVRSEVFDRESERAMGHIELARWADYVVIAPASANCLAKLAHGLADDLLTTLCLVTEAPLLVCPAMNRSMWAHPATVANVQTLTDRGVITVGPVEGSQACGDQGLGRMSEVDAIVNAIRLVDVHQMLRGRRVMITAGPTREALDPVRYLSNRSSGKMGFALAEAALMAGATVTLITGPTSLTPPAGVSCFVVETAKAMQEVVLRELELGMVFMSAAAVADYCVKAPSQHKIKRQHRVDMTLDLEANPDILSDVVATGKAFYTVGFAAETDQVLEHARDKLERKRVDMVIANAVGQGLGFDVDDNQVTVLTNNTTIELLLTHKVRLAGQIIAILAANLPS